MRAFTADFTSISVTTSKPQQVGRNISAQVVGVYDLGEILQHRHYKNLGLKPMMSRPYTTYKCSVLFLTFGTFLKINCK